MCGGLQGDILCVEVYKGIYCVWMFTRDYIWVEVYNGLYVGGAIQSVILFRNETLVCCKNSCIIA